MSAPKSFIDCVDYLEALLLSHLLIKTVRHGYPDEVSGHGNMAYPAAFIEAETSINETAPGQNTYSMFLQYLDKPAEQNTQPGTRAEFELLDSVLQIAEECHEHIKQSGQVRDFKAGNGISLNEQGNDMCVGWRFEISFTVVKYIDRNTNALNFI